MGLTAAPGLWPCCGSTCPPPAAHCRNSRTRCSAIRTISTATPTSARLAARRRTDHGPRCRSGNRRRRRRNRRAVRLTARSLRRAREPRPGLHTVRVCENPVVVETAAARLGPHALPLICVYGRPSIAAWLLLEGLATAGARLLMTCDRDAAGQHPAPARRGRLAGQG
ncbi:DUF2399 domain-containing protein [Micromonospora chokoriensis]